MRDTQDPERLDGWTKRMLTDTQARDALAAALRLAHAQRVPDHYLLIPPTTEAAAILAALASDGWVLVNAETLDVAMASAGIHVDAARPSLTRKVGCESCAKGVAAILAALRETP